MRTSAMFEALFSYMVGVDNPSLAFGIFEIAPKIRYVRFGGRHIVFWGLVMSAMLVSLFLWLAVVENSSIIFEIVQIY
jgi:hypothetical protein